MQTKITYYRNKISMTQEKLAEIVGVTRQTIISLEQNRYNPSLLLAYKITKVLGRKVIEDVFVLE
ncbi:helix-turn-helix transcriptional regulator [Candidatus Nomurabacteria bacterium]|nr:helix-turn-helix transcriptional regulator [Candidatus Nomurabacteria bacterium]